MDVRCDFQHIYIYIRINLNLTLSKSGIENDYFNLKNKNWTVYEQSLKKQNYK